MPCGGQCGGTALGCQLIVRIVHSAAFWGVVPVADLLHGRLFGAVRIDDAVAAEVVIGRALVKISAVAQYAAAHCIGMPERLIHVVPDEAALILFVPVDQRNVAFHPAELWLVPVCGYRAVCFCEPTTWVICFVFILFAAWRCRGDLRDA